MKPEKREHEPRTDWPGEYEFHFGMCPTCHKTDGSISIEGTRQRSSGYSISARRASRQARRMSTKSN